MPDNRPDDCEDCFARESVGLFDVDGVETHLCAACAAQPRTLDGAVVAQNGVW